MSKIAYDAKRYFHNRSGLGNYSRDLVRIMQQHYPAHDYYLYSPKGPKGEFPKGLHTRLPKKGLINRLLPAYWRSKGIVQDLVNDGIQVYHGLSGEIPVGLTKTKIKSVVSIHDLIFLRLPDLYKATDRAIYNKKFKYACQHADQVVAISEQTKADIVEFYDIAPDRIEVIYQGCHPAFKQKASTASLTALRQKYQLPENFILNVGSIEARKNAFQLVKAVEQLDIPLVIIGKETAYAQDMKAYIAAKKLENRILFPKVSSMDELAGIYQLADIFAYPSSYEGFGIPIIEALYSGTPVITSRDGVFPEAAGPASRFIDPNDVSEIRQAIQEILDSSEQQALMRQQGLAYAQRFNDEVLAQQWMDIYL